jgi:protein-L-isoaspartate(D-aspartate) O-methyltransferase
MMAVLLGMAMQTGEYAAERKRMLREHLEARGVRDARVLRAMAEVPRHLFVPAPMRGFSYSDHPLQIGHGQTISQPYIVATMAELLDVRPESKVLEIGAGSGYAAAVLAKLGRQVYAVEIVPELAAMAAENLKAAGVKNVTVRHGDGYAGWPEQAPFDRILLSAAPEEIPYALVDQLARGGQLVAPVGEADEQVLVIVRKDAEGKVTRARDQPVRFVPMVRGKN